MNKRKQTEGQGWSIKSMLPGYILSVFLWIISAVVLSGQILDYQLTVIKSHIILSVLNIPILLLGILLATQKVKPLIASISVSLGYIITQWFFAVVLLGGKMQRIEMTLISILVSNAVAEIIIYLKKSRKRKHRSIYR